MHLVAIEAITRAEARDLALDKSLLGFEPCEFSLVLSERSEVLGDERAHRAAAFRGPHTRGAVDILGDGDGDVGHCLAQ